MTTIPIAVQYRICSAVPAGVVAASKQAREARRYVEFLASPEAARIFRKHGYGVLPQPRECKTEKR